MKVNRLELIGKLREMIAEKEASAAARKAEAIEKNETAEYRYVQEHADDWAALADAIRKLGRQGRALTIEDVPKGIRSGSGQYAHIEVFRPGKVRESDHLPRTEHLNRLLAVLESSPDEYVSTSALDRIGAPLRELMRP